MAVCDNCGNNYDKAFQLTMAGKTYFFDSFECAIHHLAPRCKTCETPILGHGVENDGVYFCCAHCAQQAGESNLKDRA